MQSVSVIYYDGISAKPHQAEMSAINSTIFQIQYEDQGLKNIPIRSEQMTLIGALGKKKPVIELSNDGRIEFLSLNLPEWLQLESKAFNKRIWVLERSPTLIIFSVVFVVALAFSLVKWGIPFAANVVAFQLPESTLDRIGDKAQDYVMEQMTKPSHLQKGQQEQISQLYLEKVAENKPAKLIFREGGQLGANAVALPNNTIIVTDELVEMAHSDQEILGVLAHEQGHIIQRHSLQQALASLGFSVLYIAVTGDSSDFVTTLPLSVVGANYSRQFEAEADMYALKLMDRKGIEVSHFANFLQRLSDDSESVEHTEKTDKQPEVTAKDKTEAKTVEKGQEKPHEKQEESRVRDILDVFSSHPATEERIQMVRDFEKQQKKIK